MPYFVYIILCSDGTYYTGSTENLEKRARLHAEGRGARYTKSHPPMTVAYTETYVSRSEAMRRESAIKKMSRQQKENLIDSQLENKKKEANDQEWAKLKSKMERYATGREIMPKLKPTWTEKLNNAKSYPKVVPIHGKMVSRWGTGTMVIPAPIEVDELMRQIPIGKLTTINNIRAALAKKHGATISCPITTGIFCWIAAHAAEEQRRNRAATITPYWRTLKGNGLLNPKYPGGVRAQKKTLETEGHAVVRKGKNYLVQDYEEALAKI